MNGKSHASLAFLHLHRFQLIALLKLVHHILAALHLAENRVLAIQPIRDHVRYEKLAAIRAWPGVRHRQRSPFVTLRIILGLVFEAITGATAAASGRIATLHHEVGDDAME